jgi:hypothetical protein
MILRTLENKLKELSKKFPVISITGPRQSGKTTLVRHAFTDYHYVSLEEPDTRLYAQSDPRGFLNNHPDGLIIDEVQRVPELFSYIQSIVDDSKKTGQLKLLPFSLDELKNANVHPAKFEPLLLKGFYPRLYDKKIAPEDYYPYYIQTYLERDVRQIKNITDLNAFNRFLKLCAGRIGQLVNLSALGQETGITHSTIKAWISLLEASYILFLLYPHHHNFSKRLVKSPKLYFFDTGLACSLLGITQTKQIETHYLRGSIFENMVISDIFKSYTNKGQEPPVTFWRDKTGHEIDLIIDTGNVLQTLEIKSGQTISNSFFKDLYYFKDLSGQTGQSSTVIYGGDKNQTWNDIRVISWQNLQAVNIP